MIAHDRMIVADSERRDADALAHARQGRRPDRDATSVTRRSRRANGECVEPSYNNVATGYVNMHLYDDGMRYARRVLEIARSNDVARVGSVSRSACWRTHCGCRAIWTER